MKKTFREIREKIDEYGVLSLDLETDNKIASEVKELELIAMAAGKGTATKAVAVPPSPAAISFVQEHLSMPNLRVVGHNVVRFDLEVLQHLGIFNLQDVKAKVVDTLPLSWLFKGEIPHGLKPMVKRIFNYDMVTYEEAYLHSPAIRMIRETERVIADLEKHVEKIVTQINKEAGKEKKRLNAELKEKYKGRRKKKDQLERKKDQKKIETHIKKRFGPKVISSAKKKIEKRIDDLKAEIVHLNVEAEKQKVEYAEDDARQTMRLYYYLRRHILNKGIGRWAEMEVNAQFASAAMEMSGVHVDPDSLEELDKIFVPLLEEFESEIFGMAKMEFNPNSPDQVSQVLYDIMGFHDYSGEKSTAEKVLMRIGHPLPQMVLNYRSLRKLRSSFITKLRAKALKDKEHRIFARFNPIGARRTGRASCSKPNLQQIPSRYKPQEYDERIQKLGPKIRESFCAPVRKRGRKKVKRKLVIADLSQIELRLIAHVTGDARLNEVYTRMQTYNGIVYPIGDVHDETRKFVSALVGYDIGRKLAKNLNFGLCYGMGAEGFARYASLFKADGTYDVEGANAFRNAFMDAYCGIPETMEALGMEWYSGVRNFKMLSGRERHFWEKSISPGTILNTIIQGTAADLLKIVEWAIYENLIKNPAFNSPDFNIQVHDEVMIEVDADQAEAAGVLVKYLMELPWFNISVPSFASAKVCDSWADNGNDDIPEVGHMPPEESGIKPAVAILDEEQKQWASTHLLTPFECFNEVREEQPGFISVEEFDQGGGYAG
jgi:DNA polymerase I-like protein with 3'-5' exonuclease and polymerase domains